METKKLLLLFVLAVIAVVCWAAGNELLSPDSRLLAATNTVAYPASIILGAGALAGLGTRLASLRTSQGHVSLAKTGVAFAGLLTIVLVFQRCGGTLAHNLSLYFLITLALSYVFLVLLRSRAA